MRAMRLASAADDFGALPRSDAGDGDSSSSF